MSQFPEERGLYRWVRRHIDAPHSYFLFFSFFSLEAFLLIPLDPLLAFFVMQRRDDAYRFALMGAVGSVVSALMGYAVGSLLWESIGQKIVLFFVTQVTLTSFILHYQLHYFPALFIGSLLPFPFKVLTISAGFCLLPLVPYCSAIGLARLIRFFAIAYVSKEWGHAVRDFISRYGKHILLLLALKILIAVVCYSVFFK